MNKHFVSKTMTKIFGVIVGFTILTACETVDNAGPRPSYPPTATPSEETTPPPPTEYAEEEFVTTEALEGKEPIRVALLLPFTSTSSNVEKAAQAMENAAELAVFESKNERYLLISKDTKGTPEGAAIAAREALSEGAELVLGPLFSDSVLAASRYTRAAGVPMIAFSSDMNTAGNGVYLLSFPPEMEIARVTDYAVNNGFSRFGLLTPQSEYGQRVSSSFAEEAYVRGGIVVHEERYEQKPESMFQPAKRLANYAEKCSTMRQEKRNASAFPASADDMMMQEDTSRFEAVLVPEKGTLLRALAPLLPYYDVNVKCIKLLGVSAWNNPLLTREPALSGGWFAAPDPALSENFKNRYNGVYGENPPRLASLAYDAALLTARLAAIYPKGDRFTPVRIADPNGYLGADGLFRLTQAGTVERGLAILEIRSSGIKVIDPAPSSFTTIDNSDDDLGNSY